MPKNYSDCKSVKELIFVTNSGIVSWYPDSDHPDSVPGFITDCRREGWPVWIYGETASVFAANTVFI